MVSRFSADIDRFQSSSHFFSVSVRRLYAFGKGYRCPELIDKVRVVLFMLTMIAASTSAARASGPPIPAMFSDAHQFVDAINKEKPKNIPTIEVTGISVPHHLLGADLIARGFWAAALGRFQRIIIISPDHFSKSRRPLATTRKDIDTVFGALPNDRAATTALLTNSDLFDDNDLFAQEHGVAALLPFVKHFFPDAQIVPIVVSYTANRSDWDAAITALHPYVGPGTLIVQSTDYSHYLPQEIAQQRDQETLNIIAAGDVEGLVHLLQPDHLDSKGSQYIQMRIQAGSKLARGIVVANRSSREYTAFADKTTSYIVTVYSADPRAGAELRYDDQDIIYFGGDVFIGRWFTRLLADPDVARDIVNEIRLITRGAPMVINLEGLLLIDPPLGLNPDLHVMHASLAVPILQALNVKAASYANNHSYDLGVNGVNETVAILKRAGIVPLGHMKPSEVGSVGLVAVNFIGVRDYRGYPVISQSSEIGSLCAVKARSPLIAFVHWGEEYTQAASPRDIDAASRLHICGVNAVIGSHSHRALTQIQAMQGGEYQISFSLGNLLFDQRSDRASSALLELRLFKQGTFATVVVPLNNLFELALTRLTAKSNALPAHTPRPTGDHGTY